MYKNVTPMSVLPKGVPVISADQRPLDGGLLAALAIERAGIPIQYYAHTVDGQGPLLTLQANVTSQKDFGELVLAQLRTSQFSLASFSCPWAFPWVKVSELSQVLQVSSKVLGPVVSTVQKTLRASRLHAFCTTETGVVKGSLSQKIFPELGKLVSEFYLGGDFFAGYFPWMELISHSLTREMSTRAQTRINSLKGVIWTWKNRTSLGVYDLWWDFASRIVGQLPKCVTGSTLDLFMSLSGEIYDWWRASDTVREAFTEALDQDSPFFLLTCLENGAYIRSKLPVGSPLSFDSLQRDSGAVGIVPNGYLLYLWLRHNYVVASGGIPYDEKLLSIATKAGLKLHPQIQVKVDVGYHLAANALVPTVSDLWRVAYPKLYEDMDDSTANVIAALARYTQYWWMTHSRPDVVTAYILGGTELIDKAIGDSHLTILD